MSNIGSYEDRYKSFDWKTVGAGAGVRRRTGTYNIGYYCSDRICEKGLGSKLALIWEGFTGEVKKYTYDDIRAYSNTTAKFLQDQGVKPGDRVCLFMDKIPELYICFLGILKMGAIAQPLFSAFGEESLITRLDDAKTKAVLTTRKHSGKVRRIRKTCRHLATIIIVDRRRQAAARGRGRLRHGEDCRGWNSSTWPRSTARRRRCCTTPRGRPESRRAPCTSTSP